MHSLVLIEPKSQLLELSIQLLLFCGNALFRWPLFIQFSTKLRDLLLQIVANVLGPPSHAFDFSSSSVEYSSALVPLHHRPGSLLLARLHLVGFSSAFLQSRSVSVCFASSLAASSSRSAASFVRSSVSSSRSAASSFRRTPSCVCARFAASSNSAARARSASSRSALPQASSAVHASAAPESHRPAKIEPLDPRMSIPPHATALAAKLAVCTNTKR
jgi:hypothetical protein